MAASQVESRERLGAGPELEGLMGTVDGFPGVLVCLLDAPHPQLGALHRGLVYPSQEVGVCLRTCVISSKQIEAVLLRLGKSRRVLGRAAGRREPPDCREGSGALSSSGSCLVGGISPRPP